METPLMQPGCKDRRSLLQLAGFLAVTPWRQAIAAPPAANFDVVVYGATLAGVIAGMAAAGVGARVLLIAPGAGLAEVPVHRLSGTVSFSPENLRLIGGIGKDLPAQLEKFGRNDVSSLRALLASAALTLYERVAVVSITKERGRIRTVSLEGGETVQGSVFIDASGEGDLLAMAGVPFVVGREAATRYGESLAGVRFIEEPVGVSPRDAQGLLPGVSPAQPGEAGDGDGKVASYQLRLLLTRDRRRRVPLREPAGYQPRDFELLGRCLAAGAVANLEGLLGWHSQPGGNVEVAGTRQAPVSLDLPGMQGQYPTGSPDLRQRIYRAHRAHTHGLLWFLRTDRRVPVEWRTRLAEYGLCGDLWPENQHWQPNLHVREARRMVGELIITQRDLTERREKTDSIGLGLHNLDCPIVDRFAHGKDAFINEGRLWRSNAAFEVPWLAITPQAAHCENLLVPVCLSASHVAWHALRQQQTQMAIAESAGIAAALAAGKGKAVQELEPVILQAKLRRVGLVLDLPNSMR